MAGSKPVTERERQGRHLLSRNHYGDGRWGSPDGARWHGGYYDGWYVIKHRPAGPEPTWARSLGRNANKVHAVRYHLVATHTSGVTQRLTAWMCGGQSWSDIEPVESPDKVCTMCTVRLAGQTETSLTN